MVVKCDLTYKPNEKWEMHHELKDWSHKSIRPVKGQHLSRRQHWTATTFAKPEKSLKLQNTTPPFWTTTNPTLHIPHMPPYTRVSLHTNQSPRFKVPSLSPRWWFYELSMVHYNQSISLRTGPLRSCTKWGHWRNRTTKVMHQVGVIEGIRPLRSCTKWDTEGIGPLWSCTKWGSLKE